MDLEREASGRVEWGMTHIALIDFTLCYAPHACAADASAAREGQLQPRVKPRV